MKRFITIIFLAALISCEDDPTPYTDPLLLPYMQRFELEASQRGFKFDYNIVLKFGKLDSNVGAKTFHRTRTIVIDSTKNGYQRRPENTIFHEFGHLFLGRPHDDRLLPNGDPRSIMNSGKMTPNFERVNAYKREYYINELFNSKQEVPDWGM